MEEKDWIILETLHHEQNITKAAEKLYISQPALTYRIQQLEKEFGVKIVNRGRRGIQFTPQGEHLVKYAKDMRLQLRQTKEFLRNMDNKVTGILRLGVASNIATYILPSILKQFLEQYPDVEVRVMTDWSSNLVHSVYSQHVHIGMIRGDYDWPDEKHLMMEENICIVSKHEIRLQDLPSLPRINYKTEPSLQNTIDLWWKERYSLPPNIAMKVDKMETGKEMVLNGLGYAILPTIVLGGQEDLYKINLTTQHGEPWKRKSWMIYRKESLNLTLIKEFVDFMKNRDLETPKRR
ncbi:LysR family transcriptional regulator [Paenibacillus thiaminolyticus]|uniref:LysR family transcriptional regulator n=1 Tax=Paenibacillus thiaminolyticus TaxID=49283 RepID=A0AAP9J2I5_PANTH|nr:LysR family transcriptional regulator [Paenibacillus thiaminolyticus]MCY9536154.1 LysR family transcriptional regulator [Paenibacillus thiaminolyticus]MCY9603581.1 LysR family transcriptional regulator [Paenibacillus thiaminolyticus]MCY9605715.1 LysR family transcriptional regulator [Paenibacillus thiaminolyticus]MCY9611784.1 LysR family transcriptional regulator [Paenibacillus thiaminolyticus]MCY9621017.1 LysR family transcriptional regulator [Paenibacillus thiaminolyticus]